MAILAPADADAARRRRSSGNYYSSGSSNSTTSSVTPVSKSTEPQKPTYVLGKQWTKKRTDRTEYDYNWAARRDWYNSEAKQWLFSDRVRIKLRLREDLAKIEDQLKIKMSWAYMHRSKHISEVWAEVQRDGEDRYLELTGLEEGRLVQVGIEIFRPKTATAADGDAKVTTVAATPFDDSYERVGAIHAPYYGVTGSETNDEWQTRAQIISFSFSQWYHDEAYGGRYSNYDCWSFYRKSADSELAGYTKKSVSNSDVPRLSKEGKRFHGDYLIMSGHYGMALCYDEDRDHFCSIEGNYALSGPHRIQIDKRYHNLYTWHTIMSITPVAESKPQPVQTVSSKN